MLMIKYKECLLGFAKHALGARTGFVCRGRFQYFRNKDFELADMLKELRNEDLSWVATKLSISKKYFETFEKIAKHKYKDIACSTILRREKQN